MRTQDWGNLRKPGELTGVWNVAMLDGSGMPSGLGLRAELLITRSLGLFAGGAHDDALAGALHHAEPERAATVTVQPGFNRDSIAFLHRFEYVYPHGMGERPARSPMQRFPELEGGR
jgi:hypothetical protein